MAAAWNWYDVQDVVRAHSSSCYVDTVAWCIWWQEEVCVTIGVEAIKDASVLLLNEPMIGLDLSAVYYTAAKLRGVGYV